ncbi:hypothetical protein B4U80_06264, partial [Leptotrombidium deliense]
MDSNGKTLSKRFAPFNKGERLELICEVNGGKSPPS